MRTLVTLKGNMEGYTITIEDLNTGWKGDLQISLLELHQLYKLIHQRIERKTNPKRKAKKVAGKVKKRSR